MLGAIASVVAVCTIGLQSGNEKPRTVASAGSPSPSPGVSPSMSRPGPDRTIQTLRLSPV
jgi:hypothetical protein